MFPRALALTLVGVLVVVACDGGSSGPPEQRETTTQPTSSIHPSRPTVDEDAELPADVYSYLEDPERTGENQLGSHVLLRPFADAEAARRDEPSSPWERSLDGAWRLMLSDRPEDVPRGFWRTDVDTADWPEVDVPHTWQSDDLDHPIFRNIATEMVPDDPPRVPRDVNPTGAYVRQFDVPDEWWGRRTVIRFDGVTSAWFLWVNGRYVGYDQGGYLPAEFDITDYLVRGTNRVAVQVHRWSAGSYLEDYDQWRYAGIFRSVTVYSTPTTWLHDASITTDLDSEYRNATLAATVDIAGTPTDETYGVTATLYDPDGELVRTMTGSAVASEASAAVALSTEVENLAKWSHETPNLYTLTFELADPAGNVIHTTRQSVGFREVEVVDGQLRLNGERVLIRGVNRAETDPDTGRHNTHERIEQDVALMQRLNINAVRTAHYPSDPHLYDVADRAGILIADEVDVETHNHETCPSDCLADRPEWHKAMLERYQGMVERDKNHPSVIIWGTGNEAGLGQAHHDMAAWSRERDPTRPLMHQSNIPNGDAPFADIAAPRYLSPSGLEQAAQTTPKPIVMGEYAHAQGNSLGNFGEFWDVVRRYPSSQGGFVWDWAEQDIRRPLITTADSSGRGVAATLSGRPEVVAGRSGNALYFSGLDDTVEIYRDPALDLTGTGLTLDAVVLLAEPQMSDFTILSKGDQYVLRVTATGMAEVAIRSGGSIRVVSAPVPSGWGGTWHRVTGTYDGTALRLYLDGGEAAATPWSGPIDHSGHHLAVGRNTETMGELYGGRTGHGTVDHVIVYGTAMDPGTIDANPSIGALLALDFDEFDTQGTYLSYGLHESGTDGLVTADRVAQPETVELAWVLAPIRITDADARAGRVTVTSERLFTDTSDLMLRWRVTEGATVVADGTEAIDVAPGETTDVQLPAPPPNPGGFERFLTVEAVTTRDEPWASAGHVVSFGQFPVGGSVVPGPAAPETGSSPLVATDGEDRVVITGDGFEYTFDKTVGTLAAMRVGNDELLHSGPELDVWRAPIGNESSSWGTDEGTSWRAVGLDRLRTTVDGVDVVPDVDRVTITARTTVAAADVSDASFVQTITTGVDRTGTVQLTHHVEPVGGMRALPYLPRIGLQLRVPATYDTFTWYGRGPVENYRDRHDGTPIGVWSTSVDEQFVDYLPPQDHGNHTDVRWVVLADDDGGLLVSGDAQPIESSVTGYDGLDRAPYPHMLVRNDGWNTLHVDHAVTGVGETPNSVGEQYRVMADRAYDYTLTLRPLA